MQNLVKMINKNESAGDCLRFWRKLKRISQLDLALDVGVSSKHLSFVETGKSQPSRDLILKMAHSLNLPLRHRNAFLKTAGYASEFGEEPFSGQKMEIVRQALRSMLEKHEPYPAFVVNMGYKILMTNSGFEQIVKFYVGENALNKFDNAYRITFAEDGLRQYIRNWPVIEHFMLGRLWDEAVSTQNHELFVLYEEISQLRTSENPIDFQIDNTLPVMELTLEKDSMRAAFFTTITTLGTPLNLTTQELRIESLFPADEETKEMFPIDI
ncbi:MAG: helix-turn-helix transcriptional regulator [Desulfobacterales bacterium]|nr:helix-turn-helix transcriptional regulator [Desulfobacterales bacterium]